MRSLGAGARGQEKHPLSVLLFPQATRSQPPLTYTGPHPPPSAAVPPGPAVGSGSWEVEAGAGAPCPPEAPSWVALDLGVPLRRDRRGIEGMLRGRACKARTEGGGVQEDTYL